MQELKINQKLSVLWIFWKIVLGRSGVLFGLNNTEAHINFANG